MRDFYVLAIKHLGTNRNTINTFSMCSCSSAIHWFPRLLLKVPTVALSVILDMNLLTTPVVSFRICYFLLTFCVLRPFTEMALNHFIEYYCIEGRLFMDIILSGWKLEVICYSLLWCWGCNKGNVVKYRFG